MEQTQEEKEAERKRENELVEKVVAMRKAEEDNMKKIGIWVAVFAGVLIFAYLIFYISVMFATLN